MKELYQLYRPKRLDDIVGQPDAVRMLKKFLASDKIPRALMFAGPSGTGKTTMARIIARKLSKFPIKVNCASIEPLETVKRIENQATFGKTITQKNQVWIFEEFQALSRAPTAQQACLDMFEEAKNCYFIICTTHPNKIIEAIRTRTTIISCRSLELEEIKNLLRSTVKQAAVKVSTAVIDKIAEYAEGSARRAMVILDGVYQLDNERDMIAAVMKLDPEKELIELPRLLCKPNATWASVGPVVKALESQGAESMRLLTIKYCQGILLGNAPSQLKARSHQIIEVFRDPTYDSFGVLVSMCFGLCK